MKSIASVVLGVCAVAAVAAQIRIPAPPRNVPLPDVDRVLRGEPPLSTGLDDVYRDVPFLDDHEPRFADMRPLRDASGAYQLRPGHWSMEFESFCVRPGTRGPSPTDGRGFLAAPLEGRHAGIVAHMLDQYGRLTDIPHRDMQTLLWAVMSRVKLRDLPVRQQAVAARVLTPAQIAALDSGAIDIIPPAMRRRLFDNLPPAIRAIAAQEQRVRELLYRADVSYEELERAAILTGPPPPASRHIAPTRWTIHPDGYLLRLVQHGAARTTVQIARPPRYVIRRDRLGRIVSVDFGDGRQTVTEYDDAIPRFAPDGLPVVGYAFKSITLVRPGANGPESTVVQGRGWTFVGQPPARPSRGFSVVRARLQPPSWMERFADWKERYDEFNEEYADRAEWYRDMWEDVTDPPPAVEQALQDLQDLEHYRDGIEAALTGDIGDRLEWLIDHQDRMNDALERATILLSGLPDTSDAEREYRASRTAAVPAALDDQRFGVSGRPAGG